MFGDSLLIAGSDLGKGIEYLQAAAAEYESVGRMEEAAEVHTKLAISLSTRPPHIIFPVCSSTVTRLNRCSRKVQSELPWPRSIWDSRLLHFVAARLAKGCPPRARRW